MNKYIGMYYYPWYKNNTWRECKVRHIPKIGFYDSSSDYVINYHVDLIKYMNIDYVIIEFLPFNDWKFNFVFENTKKLIKSLKINNIKYTLLIDPIGKKNWDNFNNFPEFFQFILDNDLNSDMFIDGKPFYLFYNPPYNIAYNLLDKYEKFYSFYFTNYNECYGKDLKKYFYYFNNNIALLDDPVKFFADKNFNFSYDYETSEFFKKLKYFQFWDKTSNLKNMNGFCPVIPGYDDLLLNRTPQRAPVVKRKKGLTMMEQMTKAVELNAEHILIYGFNEFFETTNIEPTLEYGDFYVELTRHMVKQVHNDQPITFPEGLTPQRDKIIYLTPELEQGAERHVDKIPRWDGDYWVAEILSYDDPKVSNNHYVIENIEVKNAGIRTWTIETENVPIFLGAKLLDKEKNILCEGRARIGERDIPPSEKFFQTIKVEIPENCSAKFIEIGVVWENKFWLNNKLLICLVGSQP